MTFYQIVHSRRPKIIGCYPQVSGILSPVSVYDPKYIGDRFFETLGADTVIPNALLEKKAKQTDLLSAFISGFTSNLLLSERAYRLLEDEKTIGLKFYKTYVIANDEGKHSYILVYPERNCTELLDYSRSEFSISSIDSSNGEKINIKSSDEFRELSFSFRKKQRAIRIDNIAFVKVLDYDMFCLGYVTEGGIGYYISEELKNKFEINGLTGFEYVLVN